MTIDFDVWTEEVTAKINALSDLAISFEKKIIKLEHDIKELKKDKAHDSR